MFVKYIKFNHFLFWRKYLIIIDIFMRNEDSHNELIAAGFNLSTNVKYFGDFFCFLVLMFVFI